MRHYWIIMNDTWIIVLRSCQVMDIVQRFYHPQRFYIEKENCFFIFYH